MRLFYSHMRSLFQQTSCMQINVDHPPAMCKCWIIVVEAMNLERPASYNAILNLSKIAQTLNVNNLIQLLHIVNTCIYDDINQKHKLQ